jgi:hypothetical protein
MQHLFPTPTPATSAVLAAEATAVSSRAPALDSVLGMNAQTIIRGHVPARPQAPQRDPSVLVALDQRRAGTIPESWQICVPAAYAVSCRWPVKVLAATDNLDALGSVLDEAVRGFGTGDHRTEYVPYRSRSDLRALTLEVRLVITDLPHVAGWAKEGGVDLLSIEDHHARWFTRSQSGREIIAEFARWLPATVAVEPAAAGAS